MTLKKGFIKLFTIKRVPVYLHWSFPVVGFILSLNAGFNPYKVMYYSFAYVILIAVHEIGHMLLARYRGLQVYSIYITGLGGECNIQQLQNLKDVFMIYSAGVLAETIVLLLALIYVYTIGFPASLFGQCVINTFTFVNAIMIVFTLIPMKSKGDVYNDGYVLWFALFDSFRERPEKLMKIGILPRVYPPETSLLSTEEFKDDTFRVGVEILNDNKTPMEFVVDVLLANFNCTRDEAIDYMLSIHHTGGMLLPTDTLVQAQRIASGITVSAKQNGYPLICRAVSQLSSV